MKFFDENFKQSEEILIPEENPWPTRLALVIYALIIGICISTAQTAGTRPLPGVGFSMISAGNGHGSFLAPYASVGIGDNLFTCNGLFQSQTSAFSGIRLGYSRNLSSSVHDEWLPDERGYDVLQLNAYSYAQYFHNCEVSESVIRFEQLKRGDKAPDLTNLKFNTVQVGAGIELRVNLSKAFSIRNGIGLSVYHHFDNKELLFHEQTAARLTLFTGLHFVIN